jgi:hypothetical protein
MKVEQLFVETLIDIDRKLRSNPSEYDLLKIAGLLRPILLENLLDGASAAVPVAVKFRVVEPGPIPVPPEVQREIDEAWAKLLAKRPDVKRVDTAFGIRGDLLSGEASQPGDRVLELDRRAFLNHGIITFNDSNYTVENVLRVAANSLGGIHHDDGKPNRNKRSEELRKHMEGSTWFGRPMPAAMMFEIARCTLRACQPLADELARRGLYSAASSEWTWSADGHCSVQTDRVE